MMSIVLVFHKVSRQITLMGKKTYREMIEKFSRHLPHLRNVIESSRFDRCKAICYDYSHNALVSTISIKSSANFQDPQCLSAMDLRKNIADSVQLRLIVVERIVIRSD